MVEKVSRWGSRSLYGILYRKKVGKYISNRE